MEVFLIFYLVHIVISCFIIRDIIKLGKVPEEDTVYFIITLLLCWVPFIGLLISIMLWLEYRYYSNANNI